MLPSSLYRPGLTAGFLLAFRGIAAAQSPDSLANVAVPAPRVAPLLKLGTGITNGFRYGGFGGLKVPVIVGVEHHLAPAWALTADGSSSWHLTRRDWGGGRGRDPLVSQLSLDAGIRHYYQQEKRRQEGRATGPFVGNYVALHSVTLFEPPIYSPRQFQYQYTTLEVRWGIQRRLGSYGLLDAFAGAGVSNPLIYRFDGTTGTGTYERGLGLTARLGVKISLVNQRRAVKQ